MPLEKMLSIPDIAKELNRGKATIKFLLKRFEKWLPFDLTDGYAQYPATSIKKIIFILENLDAGVLPAEIEKKLDTLSDSDSSNSSLNNIFDTFVKSSKDDDIRLSKDGLILLKSLFSDIGEQQKRVAIANEKRAEAEERKAAAIEKRAEAEEKKAEAMNNIARALHEMNKLRRDDPEAIQIAHDTAAVIANDERDLQDSSAKDIDSESKTVDEILTEVDDLSLLLDEECEARDVQPLDDLSQLIDTPSDKAQPQQELDNLAELIEDKPFDSVGLDQLDDLSLLIDLPAHAESEEGGDHNKDEQIELDDLSSLINDQSDQDMPDQDMDDLSQLIDESADSVHKGRGQELDDLASLIDSNASENSSLEIDDLSKLIDDDTPEIELDITPEEDLEKYKAAVMKVIIGLKTDGLDVEDATNCLNKNSIKTLSGKPHWSQKAISQIYKFIESAQ